MYKVKAYGKVLVFGAYSILELGNIGLVVNVNKGTTTTIEKADKSTIDLPDFGYSGSIEKIPGSLKYIRNAIKHALQYLKSKKIKVLPIKITCTNDPEMNQKGKTGLGSSATCTVSAIAAILGFISSAAWAACSAVIT